MYKDLVNLAEVDGYQSWREKEFEKLSNLIQRRLEYLQNPADCHKAKKVVCNLNKGCGYGCQLHHLVFCLTMAYGTERTLILQSKGWRYNKAGWDEIFQPVSNSCSTYHYDTSIVEQWPGENDPEIIHLSIIDNLIPTPEYVPPAIPEDISARLIRLHGDPIVWWVGQMLKYLLRPQQSLAEKLQQATRNLNFKSPIVGIHVRRTDKIGTEAAFHSIEEYMSHVNDYYDRLELMMSTQNQQLDQRRVYIATDDPKVITAAKRQYPQYEIIGDTNIAKIAAVSTRYTERSLFGIILDIYFLSKSDFIVCTFSSQVCRVAYELMQTYGLDATNKFRSLDDIYYFGGGKPHIKIAHMKHMVDSTTYYTNEAGGAAPIMHTVAGEINLEIGDKIHIAGNHWNGYSKGKNLRTNQMGLFPSFKVDDQILTARFPTYPYVSNLTNTPKIRSKIFN
ncbi:alpha-(1,6)-fucosyltransferase [Chrysoperla carnea]|uniref:alpha-(1,6)-fucosyltransferase n=1 Tax=Chrysoperla carnea TaxID=189513 RepID=UPI001D074826|nr:alpha-(1,6)-fucosyltransferase [Chrysoperla carnea]